MTKYVIIAVFSAIFGFDSARAMSVYDLRVLGSRLVGYWQLNETSGTTAFDTSGDGYNGTYQLGADTGDCQSSQSAFVRFAGNVILTDPSIQSFVKTCLLSTRAGINATDNDNEN